MALSDTMAREFGIDGIGRCGTRVTSFDTLVDLPIRFHYGLAALSFSGEFEEVDTF